MCNNYNILTSIYKLDIRTNMLVKKYLHLFIYSPPFFQGLQYLVNSN